MIDPFFFDRLMHAFTTTNATPLSRAAQQAATPSNTLEAGSEEPSCRALQEAESVAAAALSRDRPAQAGTPQADRHA